MKQLVKTKIKYFGFGFNDKINFMKLCQINDSGGVGAGGCGDGVFVFGVGGYTTCFRSYRPQTLNNCNVFS